MEDQFQYTAHTLF